MSHRVSIVKIDVVNHFMYCSPRYFARGAPLNLHAWKRMKSRLMLRNESLIYIKASPNLQVDNAFE